MKRLVSLLLVIASFLSVLSITGCDLDDIKSAAGSAKSKAAEVFNDAKDAIISAYGTAKDGAVYVYNEAAEWTVAGYEKASAKVSELVGDAQEFIAGLDDEEEPETIRYAQGDPDRPVWDLPAGVSFDETDSVTIGDQFNAEQFVTYYLGSVLEARGYTVYNGAVYYKGDIYGGLIFTKGEVFIEEDGETILSCGFVQLVSDSYSGVTVTDDMVQTGLIAVSADDTDKAFIVDEYASFGSFSGIYDDTYFSYRQKDHYVLSMSLRENDPAGYDSGVELYDFDNDKYIYTAEDAETEVARLYAEDYQSFSGARTTVNAIANVDENEDGDLSTVIVLDGKTLDTITSKVKGGADKVVEFAKASANKVKLAAGQFLNIDSDGDAQVLGTEGDADEERVTNGIISAVGSGLAAAGAVASIVCVTGTSGAVVSAIVITTGASAIVYNVSNMLAGTQDIYYGAKGDVTESQNPVLLLFKKMIPDEKTAELVYHIWGVGCTLVSNIMMPVSKALYIAKVKGLNAFQTTASVVRASVTTIAKALASGVGAGLVCKYVSKIVTKVSGDRYIGKLVGFGSCLVTGMLVYKGLDAIDKKLDISGLYPKSLVMSSFRSAQEVQARELCYSEDISNYSRGQKKILVKEIINKAVAMYRFDDAPNVKIVYDSDVYTCGSYNSYNDTLTINMRASDHQTRSGLLNTIGHEMQHRVQFLESINNPYSDMAYSYNNYISPKPDGSNYDAYVNQLCEVDAQQAGEDFSNAFLSLFGLAA